MSRRLGSRAAIATLLGAAWVAVSSAGCGRDLGRETRSGPGGEPRDSSFAAVAFQRGRSPAEVAEAAGAIVYVRYCAICHGESGEGDGFNAYNVNAAFGVTPTAFGDSAVFAALNQDTALSVIRDGGPAMGKSAAMPPWGHTLTPGEVGDVWQFIRSLPRRSRGAVASGLATHNRREPLVAIRRLEGVGGTDSGGAARRLTDRQGVSPSRTSRFSVAIPARSAGTPRSSPRAWLGGFHVRRRSSRHSLCTRTPDHMGARASSPSRAATRAVTRLASNLIPGMWADCTGPE